MKGTEAVAKLAAYPTFSSGSAAFDLLLAGGYRGGRLVEVFGGSNTGKTQLAMQAVLGATKQGERAIFIDTEGTFRPERVERMAKARGWERRGILERIVYLRVRTAAQQTDAVEAIHRSETTSACRMVAVDTFTRNFSLDYPGSSNLVRRQGALGVHLSEIARDAFLHGRAYLLTNRVTFSQSTGETRIGGRTLEQLVHSSFHLKRRGEEVELTELGTPGARKLGRITDAGFE